MAIDQHTSVTDSQDHPKRLPGPEVLATELATYEANRQELLRRGPGQYVLIKGSEIVGLYPTSDEAYEAGLARFGLTPFMIREVREWEVPFSIPMLDSARLSRRSAASPGETDTSKTDPEAEDANPGGPLATELATYEAKRAELVREAEGSHVLIKGTEIIGLYSTAEEAYEDAVERFGMGPFMIREIREHEIPLSIPALYIGT